MSTALALSVTQSSGSQDPGILKGHPVTVAQGITYLNNEYLASSNQRYLVICNE